MCKYVDLDLMNRESAICEKLAYNEGRLGE